MRERKLLGMLTPSSNTTLEPVTSAMLAGLPEVSAHFGRFRVTEIALSAQALGQFDDREILAAAELLSHAKVDVIAWNGTSSGWLGFEADERLCQQDNFSFSEVSDDQIRAMVHDAARDRPDAITIFCTNLRGAPLVEALEAEIGIPICDTISTVAWKSLRLAGVAPSRVQGWGRLFRALA